MSDLTQRTVLFVDPLTEQIQMVFVGDCPATRIQEAFQKWLGRDNAYWEVLTPEEVRKNLFGVITLEAIEQRDAETIGQRNDYV